MPSRNLTVINTNLSHVWAEAVVAAHRRGTTSLSPLVVVIEDLQGSNVAPEDRTIRQELDGFLAEADLRSVRSVANTIFPASLWNPAEDRAELYDRYGRILPRIRRLDRANQYGTYFGRLLCYGDDDRSINQLEHIICAHTERNVRRRSAFSATTFDPHRDHTYQPRRGFPCLRDIALDYDRRGRVSLTGIFTTQYLVDRGYGNYLGLYRLGKFLAAEMDLTLARLICIATRGLLGDPSKQDLDPLVSVIADRL